MAHLIRKYYDATHYYVWGRWWPKVFGLGISKTGTTTLGKALKHLGYRHRHGNRRDLLERHLAGDSASALAETAKFNAFEDWPWPLLYEDLFGLYGDAGRYILTTRRSPEVWLNSLKAHSLLTNPDGSSRSLVFGYKYPHGREREHIEFYTRHNDAVRKFFKGRDDIFLEVCWEVGDSWEKLCEFLGHSVPRSPFPHANRTEGRPIIESRRTRNQANIEQQLLALRQQTTVSRRRESE